MRPTVIPALIGIGALLFSTSACAQRKGDIDMLHELVRQARVELQTLRKKAGIKTERREGRGEHGGREGRGEHGGREGRGEGESEESGKRLGKKEKWNATRKGARLILAYNPDAQSFQGTVQNVSKKTLSEVRVEVHLSNGVELGPTKRTDLAPGKKLSVELSAADQEFKWWTTHPEHGSEEGHGPEHGGKEGAGEHGAGKRDRRPKAQALRPLFNELLLLNREIGMLSRDLSKRRRKG